MKLRSKVLFVLFSIILFLAIGLAILNYRDSVVWSYCGLYDREFVTYRNIVKESYPIVIIHADRNIRPNEYSFLGQILASKNYYVIVLQKKNDKTINRNEKGVMIPRQPPITDSSDFNQELEKRSKEILYDLEHYIKKQEKNNHLNLDANNLVLIGHSNGGDMSMMFATLHPERVSKIISLDSRRYPFPRNPKLEILRFGAIDDEPDEGVVPESGVQVIYVKGARHIDLCDRGIPEMKEEIKQSIIQFLEV